MANNRMYLKCKKDGQTFKIAKYYPSTGWYMNVVSEEEAFDYCDELTKFLELHSHLKDMEGLDFELKYETDSAASLVGDVGSPQG